MPKNITDKLAEPVSNLLNPPAKAIGNTIAAIWTLVFGSFDNLAAKENIWRQHDLREFQQNLEEEIGKIPDGDKIEPKFSIAGPALEASKFYIEEESLRKMFAKLLANSMNKNVAKDVQNSFVEIIKQMSPLDAELLSGFTPGSAQAFGKFVKPSPDKTSYRIVVPLAYWVSVQTEANCEDNAISICNLERLGLLRLDYTAKAADSVFYKNYKTSSYVTKGNLEFKEGVIEITDYGKAFIKACL